MCNSEDRLYKVILEEITRRRITKKVYALTAIDAIRMAAGQREHIGNSCKEMEVIEVQEDVR